MELCYILICGMWAAGSAVPGNVRAARPAVLGDMRAARPAPPPGSGAPRSGHSRPGPTSVSSRLVLVSLPECSVSTHLTTRKWDRLASGRDWIGIWVPSLGTRTERGPTWGCQCSLLLSSGFPRPGSEMSSGAGLLKGSSGTLEPELGSDWQPELSLSTNFCASCTERQVGNTHKELISAVEIGRGGVC